MQLRNYQQDAIDKTFKFLRENSGNPCVVMPTGSGKSLVIAGMCQQAIQQWSSTRILVLTHVKELIEQNADKLRKFWPNAPIGIYSAGLNKKEWGEPITIAGIQSLKSMIGKLGFYHLVIIDECHLISHKDEGIYRKIIKELTQTNEHLRIIGLTATPFRMGHGYIIDKPALFDEFIEPIELIELINQGFLSTLRSKLTSVGFDLSKIKKIAGEYDSKSLDQAINTDLQNQRVVQEIIQYGHDRNSWIVFCAGVSHAEAICKILTDNGIKSECVTGETSNNERKRILDEFKSGKIKCLTNANVLTTGFDHPEIDLVALVRPTLSPGLYIQMVGRGLRLKEKSNDCIVLDFAGCVKRHGPITSVVIPRKFGEGGGEAATKTCPKCFEICSASQKKCQCGFEFPVVEKTFVLDVKRDVLGIEHQETKITNWSSSRYISKKSGKEMIRINYVTGLISRPICEYLSMDSPIAIRILKNIFKDIGCSDFIDLNNLDLICKILNQHKHPEFIEHCKNKQGYDQITRKIWNRNLLENTGMQ